MIVRDAGWVNPGIARRGDELRPVDDDADGMPERIADVHGGTAAGVATHVLVRVSLRSADALSTRRVQAPEARTLPAAPLSADGYLRRSYSMTVALRNNRSAS